MERKGATEREREKRACLLQCAVMFERCRYERCAYRWLSYSSSADGSGVAKDSCRIQTVQVGAVWLPLAVVSKQCRCERCGVWLPLCLCERWATAVFIGSGEKYRWVVGASNGAAAARAVRLPLSGVFERRVSKGFKKTGAGAGAGKKYVKRLEKHSCQT